MAIFPYLIYATYFLVVDMVWIQSFVLPTYQAALDTPFRSLSSSQDIFIALFVYALLLVGNIILGDMRSNASQSLNCMVMYGGLFGLVVYGVYSGTNYVIFPQWTTYLVLTDTLWGAFLCSSSLAVLYFTRSYFGS